jgi:hypothetical protein
MALVLFEADEGATIRASDEITVDGDWEDPATVTVKVRAPDGTITTATPTNDDTGFYHYDFSLTAPGIWVVRFESTGNEGAEEVRLMCRRSFF